MKPITLSINPSYFCNFRCTFCYLTKDQLADRKNLDLARLEKKLIELQQNNIVVEHIDLYGGEVLLQKTEYIEQIIHSVQKLTAVKKINLISNLSILHPILQHPSIDLSVSYDFSAREKHELVFQNMLKLEKPYSVLMLASPDLMQTDIGYMISFLNTLTHLQSVEIKPYSTNQANQLNTTYSQYEEFIKNWITHPMPKKFRLINEDLILDSLDGVRNAYSDNHLYITPQGNWAVLEFDKNDHEFFLELQNLEEYKNWHQNEKTKVLSNPFCSTCRYQSRCLTEHYRDVKSLNHSCNGFRHLLDWADDYYAKFPTEQNNLL